MRRWPLCRMCMTTKATCGRWSYSILSSQTGTRMSSSVTTVMDLFGLGSTRCGGTMPCISSMQPQTGDGFSVDYRFPDAVYHNRFARMGKGWRWTIVEQAPGKPDKLFAEYKLTPATCRGITFGF